MTPLLNSLKTQRSPQSELATREGAADMPPTLGDAEPLPSIAGSSLGCVFLGGLGFRAKQGLRECSALRGLGFVGLFALGVYDV